MTMRPWIAALTMLGHLLSTGIARDLYVSPRGLQDAAGTRSSPWDLASTLKGRQKVAPGDTVYLLGGTYRRRPEAEYAIRLAGESHRPIHVRPASGEHVVIDGGLSFEEPCAYVWVWELEVLVSENFTLPRELAESGSHPKTYGRPSGGVHLRGGEGCKLIHLSIHDCAQGVSAWSSSTDMEIYGCLIHENGWKAPDRGHGHAIYTQNKEGTKTIRHCILSAKYPGSYTLHAYGSSRAYVDNFLVEGNIAHGLGPFLIGGGRPSRGIRVLGNALHGVDLRLGYNASYNEDCEVRENLVVGGGLYITNYRSVEKEGNEVFPRGAKLPDGIRICWYPSRYLPRRAHLAVYDFSGRGGRVEIPLTPSDSRAFLVPGMGYRVLDPRDVFGKPLSEGTTGSGTLPVSMEGGFGAFVVERFPEVRPCGHGG